MTPRPFHRWKSLWFGIFVIATLCWGWHRSVHFWEALCLGPPRAGNCVILAHRNGSLSITLSDSSGWSGVVSGFPVVGSGYSPVSIWSDSRGNLRHFQISRPLSLKWSGPWRGALVAHWFLILLFAIIWITWLVRRARRFKRLVSLQGRDPTSGRSGWGESP
jgi:hypothetical protein